MKGGWEIENINQPFWMFISKSFCSNPGVDAQIIQISLTFHSSLLHSFEFKTLQVNAPVGRVLLLLRAVQSKCNKKWGPDLHISEPTYHLILQPAVDPLMLEKKTRRVLFV